MPKTPAKTAPKKAAPKKAAPAKAAPKAAPAKAVPKAAPKKAAPEENGNRKNMVAVLGIHVPPARCETHQKTAIVPEEIAGELQGLVEQKEQAKANGEDTTEIQSAINELSKGFPRVGRKTSIATASICEKVLSDLLTYCYTQAVGNEKTQVDLFQLTEATSKEDIEAPLALIRSLPTFRDWTPEAEAELREQLKEEAKAEKEEREARKAAKDAGQEVPKKERVQDHAIGFATYVDKIKESIHKETPEFESVARCSKRLRSFLSDITIELISNLIVLAREVVNDNGVHTLNAGHILTVMKMLMINEGVDYSAYLAFVEEKLEIFTNHIEAEKQRKYDEKTDEEKAELQQKALEKETERKKKQVEVLAARARETAAKAKQLQSEI